MDNKEKMRLIRALEAASNAFHDALREHGYYVSYSITEPWDGSIRDNSKPITQQTHLGSLEIKWKLK